MTFKDIFPGLPRPWNFQQKIQDFPGLSRRRGNPVYNYETIDVMNRLWAAGTASGRSCWSCLQELCVWTSPSWRPDQRLLVCVTFTPSPQTTQSSNYQLCSLQWWPPVS